MKEIKASLRCKSLFSFEEYPIKGERLDWMLGLIGELERYIDRTPSRDDFSRFRGELRVKNSLNVIEEMVGMSYKEMLEEYISAAHYHSSTDVEEFRANDYTYESDATFSPGIGAARIRLNNVDRYEKEADGHIYMLQCIRTSDHKRFWYVGQSVDLPSRIKTHLKKGGDFNKVKESELGHKILVPSDEIRYLIEIQKVRNVYKDEDESDKHFQRRLKWLEMNRSRKAVDKIGVERVLGGG